MKTILTSVKLKELRTLLEVVLLEKKVNKHSNSKINSYLNEIESCLLKLDCIEIAVKIYF